ncbi:MAG: DNA polymerase beta superfamily protein [Mangrovibacterium sp.]
MENKIKKYLAAIEKDKGIKILLACETGSRAWGFPSPDSDFDVRIIYKHDKDWYLGLTENKDTVELMLDNNEIDISSWDLRKSLRLLWKSNPPLLERIQSPIIYKVDDDFLYGINTIAKDSYSRIATIHHYLSMAKRSFAEIEDKEQYKLKKFFYALRASVACKWILDKRDMPPTVFPKMLEGLQINSRLKERIYELIKLKATISEAYLHTKEIELNNFIQECIERADNESKDLPASKADMNSFNSFFLKMLNDQ